MRKLVIPEVSFTALGPDGVVQPITAAEQMRQIAAVPSRPDGLLTIDEIRARLPLVEKLEEASRDGKKEVLLEDAEYGVLLETMKASMWRGVSQAALDLVEAVETAAIIEVAEQGGGGDA